ncbi:hypothetical protein ACL9RL_09330 [Plantibacter sp. Mn2098]|uniref:hypothetical protein n=1 Tax=Plantibacter sp. Mn2098 TaxID=3395266 RepID=UPI003BC302DC
MMRGVTLYVHREAFIPGATDAHGNAAESWAAPVRVGIYAYNPGTTEEPVLPGHDRVITAPSIYFPSTVSMSPRDRITVEGDPQPWEVDGETLQYRNPFDASMNGNTVNLKRVSG